MEKNKMDKRTVATKVMAGFLAFLMIVGTVGTLAYCLINYVFKK